MDDKLVVDLQTQNKELVKQLETLKASLHDNDVKGLKEQAEKLVKDNQVLSNEKSELSKEVATLKASVAEKTKLHDEVTKNLDEVVKSRDELKEKLSKVEQDKSYAGRISLVKEKLGLTEDAEIKEFVDNLSVLGDEAFTKHVELQTKLKAGVVKVEEVKKPDTDTKVLDTVVASKDTIVKTAPVGAENASKTIIGYLNKNYTQTTAKRKFQ